MLVSLNCLVFTIQKESDSPFISSDAWLFTGFRAVINNMFPDNPVTGLRAAKGLTYRVCTDRALLQSRARRLSPDSKRRALHKSFISLIARNEFGRNLLISARAQERKHPSLEHTAAQWECKD